jgi:hypothetical protein
MGFFSWRSCVSGHDIMNNYGSDDLYDGIAILLPDNTMIRRIITKEGKSFDIYGLIAKFMFGKENRDLIFDKEGGYDQANEIIKVMLLSEVKEGMLYKDFPVSKNAEGQGHWMSDYETRI